MYSKSTAMATVRSPAHYNEGVTQNFFVSTANESMLMMNFFDHLSPLDYPLYTRELRGGIRLIAGVYTPSRATLPCHTGSQCSSASRSLYAKYEPFDAKGCFGLA